MTNTLKLKGRIVECGYNLSDFAEAVSLSRPSLRRKLLGDVDFRTSEIERMCRILSIPKNEIGEYFFN